MMARVGEKQPGESKSFDIDLSREIKRDNESVQSIISISSDLPGLAFGTVSILSAKLLRVEISGGLDGETHEITIKFGTNISSSLEVEVYVVVVET